MTRPLENRRGGGGGGCEAGFRYDVTSRDLREKRIAGSSCVRPDRTLRRFSVVKKPSGGVRSIAHASIWRSNHAINGEVGLD